MKGSANIGVVILAAGSSSRLGRPKQLVKYKNKPLLQQAIENIQPFHFKPVLLVLGANSEKIQNEIDHDTVTILLNQKWQEGIASSIRLGVTEAVRLNGNLESILFLLSDQPFVTDSLIGKLVREHKTGDHNITACRYQKDWGVPAIFEKKFFPQLLKLTGDAGAKKIIAQNSTYLNGINFKKGAFDVDTEEDYKELLRKEKLI